MIMNINVTRGCFKVKAVTRVPIKARKNTIVVTSLVGLVIFLNCLAGPIRKDVLCDSYTQNSITQGYPIKAIRFPKEYVMANLAGCPENILKRAPKEIKSIISPVFIIQ